MPTPTTASSSSEQGPRARKYPRKVDARITYIPNGDGRYRPRVIPPREVAELDWTFREAVIWLAGIVEGEGYIGNANRSGDASKRNYQSLRIAIAMTDEDVIARVARFWERSVRTQPGVRAHYKLIYQTQISGPDALAWMFMLYPFLGERRRARIRQVLEAWRPGYKPCPHWNGFTRWRVCLSCQRANARPRQREWKRQHPQGYRARTWTPEQRQRQAWQARLRRRGRASDARQLKLGL